jgi:hypothetical protein
MKETTASRRRHREAFVALPDLADGKYFDTARYKRKATVLTRGRNGTGEFFLRTFSSFKNYGHEGIIFPPRESEKGVCLSRNWIGWKVSSTNAGA